MGFGFQKSQLDKVRTSPRHNEALTDDNLIELSYKSFRMVRQAAIFLVFFINLLSFDIMSISIQIESFKSEVCTNSARLSILFKIG